MIVISKIGFEDEELKSMGDQLRLHYVEGNVRDIPDSIAKKAEIILSYNIFHNEEDLSKFKALKWIQLMSDGYDGIDLNLFRKKGIRLSYANGVYGIPIAEDIFAKILLFARKQIFFTKCMQSKKWQKRVDFLELAGKKMVILGTGDIGRETAKRARAFGMEVTGFNRSGICFEYFDHIINDRGELLKCLKECDFLIIAIPLTDETYHMVDEEMLAALGRNCHVVNIARGKVIDEKALIKALLDGRIAGAALDVFENEPLDKNSPLWDMENVFITPHVAGFGDGYVKRLKDLFLFNLRNYPEYINMKHMIDLEDI
jgi:D-2-hydroxyacid dehydrogenase (NADP+)